MLCKTCGKPAEDGLPRCRACAQRAAAGAAPGSVAPAPGSVTPTLGVDGDEARAKAARKSLAFAAWVTGIIGIGTSAVVGSMSPSQREQLSVSDGDSHGRLRILGEQSFAERQQLLNDLPRLLLWSNVLLAFVLALLYWRAARKPKSSLLVALVIFGCVSVWDVVQLEVPLFVWCCSRLVPGLYMLWRLFELGAPKPEGS